MLRPNKSASSRSIGGRVVTQNASTNWYLSYRELNKKGTEFYVIYGDPNARRTVDQLRVKMVFSL